MFFSNIYLINQIESPKEQYTINFSKVAEKILNSDNLPNLLAKETSHVERQTQYQNQCIIASIGKRETSHVERQKS